MCSSDLITLAKSNNLILLSKMNDYYGDSEYLPNEIDDFLNEILSLKRVVKVETNIKMILDSLESLCLKAKNIHKGIHAIAD